MSTEMNTELNTPRTDAQAGWAIANQYGQSTARELLGDPDGVFVHAVFARTLERELTAERERVRVLRLACERLRDCDWVISLPDRMDAVREIARAALDKASTEGAK